MTIQLIDSHIHLDASDYDNDRDDVIKRARQSDVVAMITIGAGYGDESAKRAVAIAENYDFIWATVGMHPHDSNRALNMQSLRALVTHPKVVAIGETGLDFFRDWSPVDMQYAWFRAQTELAMEFNKPLIIHCRNAAKECLTVLKEMQAKKVGGVFHCYSEDVKFAEQLFELNFIVSFPGSVTFKKAEQLRHVVYDLPLERMMLETDGPFLAPEPLRGKRCESSFLLTTAKKIAQVKNLPLEQVAAVTTQNACKFFNINLEALA